MLLPPQQARAYRASRLSLVIQGRSANALRGAPARFLKEQREMMQLIARPRRQPRLLRGAVSAHSRGARNPMKQRLRRSDPRAQEMQG